MGKVAFKASELTGVGTLGLVNDPRVLAALVGSKTFGAAGWVGMLEGASLKKLEALDVCAGATEGAGSVVGAVLIIPDAGWAVAAGLKKLVAPPAGWGVGAGLKMPPAPAAGWVVGAVLKMPAPVWFNGPGCTGWGLFAV